MKRRRAPKSEWYQDSYIGKSIEKAVLDKTRKAFWSINKKDRDNPYSNLDAIQQVLLKTQYAQNKIKFYATKADMFFDMGKDYWKNHSIDNYWSQYLYRDQFIANGQYADIRADEYRKDYIGALERAYGGDERADRMAANLRKLSSDEFYAVTHMQVERKFWKKDDKGNAVPTYTSGLPDISDYYPKSEGEIEQILEEGEEKLKRTFEALGLHYDMFINWGDAVVKRDPELTDEAKEAYEALREKAKRERARRKAEEDKRKKARDAGLSLPPKKHKRSTYTGGAYYAMSRMTISEKNYTSDMTNKQIQVEYLRNHPNEIRRAKDGHYYARFMNKNAVKEAMKDSDTRTAVKSRLK